MIGNQFGPQVWQARGLFCQRASSSTIFFLKLGLGGYYINISGFQKLSKNTLISKNFHWVQFYSKTGVCLCSSIAKNIFPSEIKFYCIIAKGWLQVFPKFIAIASKLEKI